MRPTGLSRSEAGLLTNALACRQKLSLLRGESQHVIWVDPELTTISTLPEWMGMWRAGCFFKKFRRAGNMNQRVPEGGTRAELSAEEMLLRSVRGFVGNSRKTLVCVSKGS